MIRDFKLDFKQFEIGNITGKISHRGMELLFKLFKEKEKKKKKKKQREIRTELLTHQARTKNLESAISCYGVVHRNHFLDTDNGKISIMMSSTRS